MRIYIVGAPASGKTTLAREISRRSGIPAFSLDQVQYEPDPGRTGANRRRDIAERDAMFQAIIARESWIIEDTGRTCFRDGMARSDIIAALDMPRLLLLWRATRRFLRQRAGREECAYSPDFAMLRSMWKWIIKYDIKRTAGFAEKQRLLRSRRDVLRFLESVCAHT